MRAITADLLAKINERNMTIYNNAAPRMEIIASRVGDELFTVETVHTLSGLTDIDTTLKRLETTTKPAKAYTIYIKDGVAHTCTKDLPYDPEIPWVYDFVVGPASAVAIEFDGYWDRDPVSKRFNFITETVPWLFWVNGGTLYAQRWNDNGTLVNLASGVVKVCAIRGWKASTDPTADQGLVVSYLKTDSLVYYRSYIEFQLGTFIWQAEQQPTEFPASVLNIGLFRTNDFRVGFLFETASALSWALTTRNFAGMSVFPEQITTGLTDYTIQVHPVVYTDTANDEHISAGLDELFIAQCTPITPTITEISNDGDSKIIVKVSHAVTQSLTGIGSYFTVRDSAATPIFYSILSTQAGANQTEIVFNMSNFASATGNMVVAYDNGITTDNLVPRLTCKNGLGELCEFAIDSFAIAFKPDLAPPEGHATEHISAGLELSIAVHLVTYHNTFTDEHISAGLSTYTIIVTKVGSNPL